MSYQLKCTQFASKKKLVIVHSFRDFERKRSYFKIIAAKNLKNPDIKKKSVSKRLRLSYIKIF